MLSVIVLGLLNDRGACQRLVTESLAVAQLADAEIAHALSSQVLSGAVTADQVPAALTAWSRLGVRRFGFVGLLSRVWELRENLTGYDATHVALAEALDSSLVTADGRLGLAPGPRCPIEVIRD